MHDVLSKIGPTNDPQNDEERYVLELLKKVAELNAKLIQADARNSQLEMELSDLREIKNWIIGFFDALVEDFASIDNLLLRKMTEFESRSKARVESKDIEGDGV